MASYRNLDSNNYPELHPSAPVRYVELQPPQPRLVAVPAAVQPTYYEPERVATEVPYATPDCGEGQTLPMALPVSESQASGMFVPPPLTAEEFERALDRPVNFDGNRYFRESKVFFKRNWCKLMTATVMWAVVFMGLACSFHRIFPSAMMMRSIRDEFDKGDDSKREVVLQLVVLAAMTLFVAMPAFASLFVAVFNAMRSNGPIRYKDFFSCFGCRYFCRLIPLSVTLKGLTGLFSLLILPAIWFSFVTIFAVPLHKEHKFLGTCGAIRASIKTVHRHFCGMLGFLILNALLQVVGFFLFGVGLLVTLPISFVALCYCYSDLIGVNRMPMLVGGNQV